MFIQYYFVVGDSTRVSLRTMTANKWSRTQKSCIVFTVPGMVTMRFPELPSLLPSLPSSLPNPEKNFWMSSNSPPLIPNGPPEISGEDTFPFWFTVVVIGLVKAQLVTTKKEKISPNLRPHPTHSILVGVFRFWMQLSDYSFLFCCTHFKIVSIFKKDTILFCVSTSQARL